jgi:hypothetical protein
MQRFDTVILAEQATAVPVQHQTTKYNMLCKETALVCTHLQCICCYQLSILMQKVLSASTTRTIGAAELVAYSCCEVLLEQKVFSTAVG